MYLIEKLLGVVDLYTCEYHICPKCYRHSWPPEKEADRELRKQKLELRRQASASCWNALLYRCIMISFPLTSPVRDELCACGGRRFCPESRELKPNRRVFLLTRATDAVQSLFEDADFADSALSHLDRLQGSNPGPHTIRGSPIGQAIMNATSGDLWTPEGGAYEVFIDGGQLFDWKQHNGTFIALR